VVYGRQEACTVSVSVSPTTTRTGLAVLVSPLNLFLVYPVDRILQAAKLLSLQPDFKEQKPLIAEIVEKSGHLCLFLPKFHCELNIIEYFWGAAKRYTREQCDYTFESLKVVVPAALASVPVEMMRRWEQRQIRWMNAYRKGLDCTAADADVRKLSIRAQKKFTSHRR
jgi:hypothetical protein